jgi:hypothetical protein
LQRLADTLNRATTMERITEAAESCVMVPFGAQAMALIRQLKAVCGSWAQR